MASAKEEPARVQTRLTQASGPSIATDQPAKIGGPFTLEPNPAFIARRAAVYDRVMAAQQAQIAALAAQETPISITLPDGAVKQGVAWKTTPLDVALMISQGLADQVVVAKVREGVAVRGFRGQNDAHETACV